MNDISNTNTEAMRRVDISDQARAAVEITLNVDHWRLRVASAMNIVLDAKAQGETRDITDKDVAAFCVILNETNKIATGGVDLGGIIPCGFGDLPRTRLAQSVIEASRKLGVEPMGPKRPPRHGVAAKVEAETGFNCFVDSKRLKLKGASSPNMVCSHLWADSIEELLAMAAKLELPRKYLQQKTRTYFYVNQTMRRKAIELGAVVQG